jgi:hypothetical protein
MRRARRQKHLSAALAFYSIVINDLPLHEHPRLENGNVEAKKSRFFHPMSTHIIQYLEARLRKLDPLIISCLIMALFCISPHLLIVMVGWAFMVINPDVDVPSVPKPTAQQEVPSLKLAYSHQHAS